MDARKESEMQAVVPLQYRPMAARQRPSRAVYRRRRLAVLLCAAALVICGWQGARLAGMLGDGPLTVAGQPGGTVTVDLDAELVTRVRAIVQPGDTLWTIARRVQPTGDVRPLVSRLDAQRDGRPLQIGETIILPVQG